LKRESKEDAMSDHAEDKTENMTRGSAAQSVRDLIERTFLAGMGVAALTKDRVEDLADELVRVGQLNAEEGRELVERLVSRSREQARAVLRRPDVAAQTASSDLPSALRAQVEDQELRLRQLEHRVQLLEAAADRPAE
jgi:polyhydroxyalkanoate synthesis regulator phasin